MDYRIKPGNDDGGCVPRMTVEVCRGKEKKDNARKIGFVPRFFYYIHETKGFLTLEKRMRNEIKIEQNASRRPGLIRGNGRFGSVGGRRAAM